MTEEVVLMTEVVITKEVALTTEGDGRGEG